MERVSPQTTVFVIQVSVDGRVTQVSSILHLFLEPLPSPSVIVRFSQFETSLYSRC